MVLNVQRTDILRIHPRAAHRNIGGKTVIVHTIMEKLLRLNRTGTAVWERLDGRSVEEIARDLASLFGEPFDHVLKDVVEFVETLAEKRLVELDQNQKK